MPRVPDEQWIERRTLPILPVAVKPRVRSRHLINSGNP